MMSNASSKLSTGILVARTLGPRWVAERVAISASERLGIAERKSPLATWATYERKGPSTRATGFLGVQAASEFLSGRPETVAKLRTEFAELTKRRFDIFGERAHVRSWHEDPITGATYDPDLHWTRVDEQKPEDLKLVWEASRFSWAFCLARLHAADPASGAAELFWELFEDWCEHNQPNAGVNWKCGQESSIRLMAVLFAVEAFGGVGETPERTELLATFADVTAQRVLAHWHYAKHQRNNHIVSEAVGLLSVACIFPELSIADEALRLGKRLLGESCRELVFEDGGTSQYSVNYHRVFMHNFLWAQTILRLGDDSVSGIDSAVERTADFLAAITDPATGRTANFGHNDGALLLPVADTDFSDMRPTLRAAGVQTSGDHAESDELAVWLGAAEAGERTSGSRLFPTMGVVVLEHCGNRAVIRGTRFKNRPSHSDQLHADLWIDGTHVVIDPGTWSYKPLDDKPDLALTRFHNGPIADDYEDMPQVSRFLFAAWSTVETESFDPVTSRWIGRRASRHTGIETTRTIEPSCSGWCITDVVNPGPIRSVTTNWLLPTVAAYKLDEFVRFEMHGQHFELRSVGLSRGTPASLSLIPTLAYASYRKSVPATLVEVRVDHPTKIRTLVVPAGQA